MKNDVLLESFKKFELSDLQKSKVIGGEWTVTGCRQNGSMSYEDINANGTYMCDVLVSSNDGSGYMASCEMQLQQ
jgi:hypothetical protein